MSATLDGVKNTFSSWDSCMSKVYCKWPVIAAIIFGSLIALSLIWCLARCLCCGVECCCGCCACCNACCPSPRSRRSEKQGYQQAPLAPYGGQYQAPPPMYAPGGLNTSYYGGGGIRGGVASTATFDSPSQKYNEDALPPMPSWNNATSRRVEHNEPGDVEMDKLQPSHTQQEVGLLAHEQDSRYDYSSRQEAADLGAGAMHTNPYHDYAGQRHQQTFHQTSYGAPGSLDAYAQGGNTTPYSTVASPPAATHGNSAEYFAGQQQPSQSQRFYTPSVAAPSYHTQDVVSPVRLGQQQGCHQSFSRKPVHESWREV